MIEKGPFAKLTNGENLYFNEVKSIINGELTIQKFFNGYNLATRTSIINHLISKFSLKKYLEIGVRKGDNFDKINVPFKRGVDPEPIYKSKLLYKETSDSFFSRNKEKFDIIFIDGLHLEDQVTKDIYNSLNILSKNGFILLHDCNPPSEFHQREEYEINGTFPAWNGTVWKSYVKIHMTNPNLKLFCVNCDWGVGIIKRGSSNLYSKIDNLNYKHLESDRKNMLNLISVKEFLELF